MQLTDYHAKFFAYELTRRFPSSSAEKIAGALVDAQVDLNPHQVDAALFAFASPLSKGAILADEVGLGKTIEAGLVISQKWAERKRRVLVITPASLRKQWYQELSEKFFLPCRILESKPYNQAVRAGRFRPFEADEIVICSYQFAKAKAGDVSAVPWDLVVIDEAHRLRNVYKPQNVTAHTLKAALQNAPKLLLTATPLQNSLLELFGLVSFIDEHTFGSLESFREQFSHLSQEEIFATLHDRLRPVCHRTLRRQVLPYVRFTKRFPIVQPFTPEEGEDRLYTLVSEYLRRDNLQALPASQRSLVTLVLRKLLASSTFAIAGALDTMVKRLSSKIAKQEASEPLADTLCQDYETLPETEDEWPEEPVGGEVSDVTRSAIEKEIADLEAFKSLALSIDHNAKGQALLVALERAFGEADRLGAARKAIVFTESRHTQSYLLRVLADSPFKEGIVLFNGTNTDDRSREIYDRWLEKHGGTDRVTGSRTADMRSALVDYFHDEGRIMIATEAGAEGINLQFCSLVVNYDLPWNPQRVEQRIGRCHRYGQQHDVVVVNFFNQSNAADQRVLQLLSDKFKLFEGVFGASDEILGAIESGVDFEKRIAGIYQRCRRPEEIQAAFDDLQRELDAEIDQEMRTTRQQLFDNFDDEVRDKLKIRDERSRAYLNRYERQLMQLTRHELQGHADFSDDSSFRLRSSPFDGNVPLGLYELPRRTGEAMTYRLNHPLAEAVLARGKRRELLPVEIAFDYAQHDGKVTALEPFVGKAGWMLVAQLTIESLDQPEDHLLVLAIGEDGQVLEEELAHRLFSLPGKIDLDGDRVFATTTLAKLHALLDTRCVAIQTEIGKRNAGFVEVEAAKLDGWADDLKLGLEREIKDLDKQIKEARRAATVAATLEEKLAGQRKVKALEAQRSEKRRSLFDAQDKVDLQREELIAKIEGKLVQTVASEELFALRWRLV